MRICVVGCGIVGIATAWQLARDGHSVTVVDRAAGPAEGTSRANGGQLSYSYVAPLADGSIWGQLPKLLGNPESPVQFRPGAGGFQYWWLARFLMACTDRQARRTTDALGALARLSRAVLHEAAELRGLDFDWTRTGKLVVYSSGKSLDAARAGAEHQARSGISKEALTPEQCLALEPALAGIAHRLTGGIFAPEDEASDAFKFAHALRALLETGDNPVAFRFGHTVEGVLEDRARRVVGAITGQGAIEADLVILCAGVAARPLGQMMGVELPIYPLKGYSLTAPVRDEAAAPRVSVTDAMRKVVLARLGTTLRLAGAADLVGEDLSLDARRLETLVRDAKADFPEAADWDAARRWAGLRPATPKGMPILGESGREGLLLNVGHGALGLTLALGAARLLGDHIAGRPAEPDIAVFSRRAA